MKNLLILLFTIMLFPMAVQAQHSKPGYLEIIADSRIDTLLAMHININSLLQENISDDGIDGYRIQIFFDSGNNSKTRANEIIEGFVERFPEVAAYISFKEPYYRVRIGDFRTKLEALGFLQKINGVYPNAWIIKDKISFPAIDETQTINLD